MSQQIFNELLNRFPNKTQLLNELNILNNDRHFFEMTEKINEFIFDSVFDNTNNKDILLIFWKEFIEKEQYFKANKLSISIMTKRICDCINNYQEANEFINKYIDNFEKMSGLCANKQELSTDAQGLDALYFTKCCRASILLKIGADNKYNCKEELDDVKKLMDKNIFYHTNAHVLSIYHHTLSNQYYEDNDYENFFYNSLKFLAYTDLTNYQWLNFNKSLLVYKMGIAVIIAPNIFSFGELLNQNIFNSLFENNETKWLSQLLKAFEKGDLNEQDNCLFNQHENIQKEALLKDNLNLINDKIKIMALIELIFNKNKDERIISFNEIQTFARIPLAQVEYVLMKSMRLNLIKGVIDGVNDNISISYVTPRVLDIKSTEIMKKRFDDWSNKVSNTIKNLDEQAQKLIIV